MLCVLFRWHTSNFCSPFGLPQGTRLQSTVGIIVAGFFVGFFVTGTGFFVLGFFVGGRLTFWLSATLAANASDITTTPAEIFIVVLRLRCYPFYAEC